MTEEQEKAIETLEHVNSYYNCNNYYSRYELDCIETALNMLKEKDKEIEKLKKENEHWKNGFERELEDNRENSCELLKQDLIIRKQEKQIDLMVEFIAILDIEEDICVKTGKDLNKCDCMTLGKCENCIKQYFKSKVEKE